MEYIPSTRYRSQYSTCITSQHLYKTRGLVHKLVHKWDLVSPAPIKVDWGQVHWEEEMAGSWLTGLPNQGLIRAGQLGGGAKHDWLEAPPQMGWGTN